MRPFGGYARYYDLLYGDKDYAGEVRFIDGLIRAQVPGARRVLELGCGTGTHGVLLAGMGYDVLGLDLSPEMLAIAEQRRAGLPADVASHVRFLQADARSFATGQRFDVVLALFHVMSYQVDDADLAAVFARVKAHLAPDGVFLFDCWYGPAVVATPPVSRVKRVADAATSIVRTAEPVLHPNDNLVEVHYRLEATDVATGTIAEVAEVHRLRYLFRPEIERLAGLHGLRIVASGEWLADRPADGSTWSVYFALRHVVA
ncbi:MAG: class I SAM-dependent methyltransferase [Chromatiales bacterium]|nr:class I SAM-dependent methyltransferase [Chromatiales bacterium]